MNVASLNIETQALLNSLRLSIAKMAGAPSDEAAALSKRMAGVNKAQFARDFGVPGGASMLSQHCSGNRPISLEAAIAYARGLGVSLAEISPRLASLVVDACGVLGDGFQALARPAGGWPLRRIGPEAWAAIDPYDRGAVEDAMVTKLRELEAERGLGGARTNKGARTPPGSKAA